MPITVKKKVKPKVTAGTELSAAPNTSTPVEENATAQQHVDQVIADVTHDMPELVLVDTPTPDAPAAASPIASEPTVVVTLPYKGESAVYLEVEIAGKQGWLGKANLVSFEVEGDHVNIEMTRTLAKRRKILEAA